MSKQARKIALGALIAGAAGYALGVLTAPKSGKETRQDIKHKALKFKLEAEHKLKALNGELSELIAQGKSKASKASAGTKKQLNEALAKAASAKEKVRQMLSALHEGDADDEELKSALAAAQKAAKHLEKFIRKGDKS